MIGQNKERTYIESDPKLIFGYDYQILIEGHYAQFYMYAQLAGTEY